MPSRCQSQQQRNHSLLRQGASLTPSFLSSIFLSAGCCVVVFLASAIVGAGFNFQRQVTISDRGAPTVADQPETEGPSGLGWPLPHTKTQDYRKAKEEQMVEGIKKFILNMTGREDSSSLWNKSENYAAALPRMDLGAGKGSRYEASKGGKIHSASRPPALPVETTNKIKEFADEVPNLIGVDGAVQFVLHPKQTPGYDTPQRVINATMKVLVRLHQQTPPGQPPKAKARRRRITIVAYLLDDEDAEKQRAPADPYLPIAQLTVLVRKTGWHKVLLPTTIVQKVLDSSDKVLRLRVLCRECNDETEVVMTPRRNRNKKTGRKAARTGRLGGVERQRHTVDEVESSTNRMSLHQAPPVAGEEESKRSPVLVVSTKSSSRFRKTV